MSMPRVGSSRIRSIGCRAASAPERPSAGCPRQFRNLFVEVGSFDRHLRSQWRDNLQRLAPVEEAVGRRLVGDAGEALSRMLRNKSKASCLRSSGAKPIPATIAACGLLGQRARRSWLWSHRGADHNRRSPLPVRSDPPHKASLARHCTDNPLPACKRARAREPRTRPRCRPCSRVNRSAMSRPTISLAMPCSLAPVAGESSTRRPSRKTTMRSASSMISFSLWEIYTIDVPSSRNRRMTENRRRFVISQ